MSTREFKFLIKIFCTWIAGLLLILFLAVKFIPVQTNFLGGGFSNYIKNPYFWSFGNFDGEHYVSIAKNGYGLGERAFFPLYPLLIRFFANIFGGSQVVYYISGILISWISFFLGLIGFYKLLRLDYTEKLSKMTIILLLLFPASFYFIAIYTESLFFALLVWSIYFSRKGKLLQVAILTTLLTATRFVGIIIVPAILAENLSWTALFAPAGLLTYMFYLKKTANDTFAFFNSLASFGEQRSTHLITLPQVFYRYIFKIVPNLKTMFFPVLFTTGLEFFVGGAYLLLTIWSFFKLRLSYAVIFLFGYLIPTFSGSFSSLPRYVLVLFPAYILFTSLVSKSKFFFFAFAIISSILLIVSFTLFARGYWIS